MYTDSIEQLRGTAGARQVTIPAETALAALHHAKQRRLDHVRQTPELTACLSHQRADVATHIDPLAGLDSAIHVFDFAVGKTWVPGSSPGTGYQLMRSVV